MYGGLAGQDLGVDGMSVVPDLYWCLKALMPELTVHDPAPIQPGVKRELRLSENISELKKKNNNNHCLKFKFYSVKVGFPQ